MADSPSACQAAAAPAGRPGFSPYIIGPGAPPRYRNLPAPRHPLRQLSYDVVDLVATAADDLPRPNLITWVADVERSRRAGELAERVRELELTKSFDLWLGALGRKWGGELPSIRDHEEARAVFLEKIDRWEAEFLQEGRQEGRLETIEGFLRAGIGWQVIQSATGIDEHTYRTLKHDSANGTEPAAPRQ